MIKTPVDYQTWTAESFLYDAFLMRHTRTSLRTGDTPIDVYNAYLANEVGIDRLCELGAEIMNFVMECGLEGIEPVFMQKHIWWYFASEELFGINLFQRRPYLTFHGLGWDVLEDIYEGGYEFRYREQYSQFVCLQDVSVEDLIDLFELRIADVSPDQ